MGHTTHARGLHALALLRRRTWGSQRSRLRRRGRSTPAIDDALRDESDQCGVLFAIRLPLRSIGVWQPVASLTDSGEIWICFSPLIIIDLDRTFASQQPYGLRLSSSSVGDQNLSYRMPPDYRSSCRQIRENSEQMDLSEYLIRYITRKSSWHCQ